VCVDVVLHVSGPRVCVCTLYTSLSLFFIHSARGEGSGPARGSGGGGKLAGGGVRKEVADGEAAGGGEKVRGEVHHGQVPPVHLPERLQHPQA
jgi:hypothetical protein